MQFSWALVNHLMDTKREFPSKVEERIAVEVRTGTSSCISGTGNNQILFGVLLSKASPCC